MIHWKFALTAAREFELPMHPELRSDSYLSGLVMIPGGRYVLDLRYLNRFAVGWQPGLMRIGIYVLFANRLISVWRGFNLRLRMRRNVALALCLFPDRSEAPMSMFQHSLWMQLHILLLAGAGVSDLGLPQPPATVDSLAGLASSAHRDLLMPPQDRASVAAVDLRRLADSDRLRLHDLDGERIHPHPGSRSDDGWRVPVGAGFKVVPIYVERTPYSPKPEVWECGRHMYLVMPGEIVSSPLQNHGDGFECGMSYFAETKQTRYVFDWMPTVRVVNKAKLQAEADIIRENNAARRLADNVIETTAPSEAAAEPSSSSGPGPTVIDDDLVPTEGRAALDPVPVQLPGIHSTGRQRVGAELTSIPEALDDAHVTGCETVVLDARPVKEELPVFDTGGGQAALEGSLETGVRKRPLDAALGLAMPYHEAHPPWVTRITLSLSRTGPHQTSMLLVPFSLDGVQVFHLAAAVYGFTQGDPRRLQLRLMAGPLLRNSGFFILHDTAPNPFPPMEPLRLEYLVPQP